MKKSIIIALGGNALSPKEEAGTIYQQFAHTRESIDNIMHFVDLEYNICSVSYTHLTLPTRCSV